MKSRTCRFQQIFKYRNTELLVLFSVMTPCIHKSFPTDTPRQIQVDSWWILRRYLEDQTSNNFHVISTQLFGVILLIKKSTSFPRTFFNVISMVEKSTLFARTFFDVISMVKKSTLFPFTFFHVVSIVEKYTVFLIFRFNFDCRKIHFVCTYFFGKISMNSTSFLVSYELMKTFEGFFLCQ